jgi:preprotein translocase subunit SecD
MTQRLQLRIAIVVVVAAVAVFYLYPPKKTINLGLDLQGGIHLVLGVDIDKALQVQTERAGDTVRTALEKKGVGVKSIERRGVTELAVQLTSPQAWADAQTVLRTAVRVRKPTAGAFTSIGAEVACSEWFVKQTTIRPRRPVRVVSRHPAAG